MVLLVLIIPMVVVAPKIVVDQASSMVMEVLVVLRVVISYEGLQKDYTNS